MNVKHPKYLERHFSVAEGDLKKPISAAAQERSPQLLTGGADVGHRSPAGANHQQNGSLHLTVSVFNLRAGAWWATQSLPRQLVGSGGRL